MTVESPRMASTIQANLVVFFLAKRVQMSSPTGRRCKRTARPRSLFFSEFSACPKLLERAAPSSTPWRKSPDIAKNTDKIYEDEIEGEETLEDFISEENPS